MTPHHGRDEPRPLTPIRCQWITCNSHIDPNYRLEQLGHGWFTENGAEACTPDHLRYVLWERQLRTEATG